MYGLKIASSSNNTMYVRGLVVKKFDRVSTLKTTSLLAIYTLWYTKYLVRINLYDSAIQSLYGSFYVVFIVNTNYVTETYCLQVLRYLPLL